MNWESKECMCLWQMSLPNHILTTFGSFAIQEWYGGDDGRLSQVGGVEGREVKIL